MAHVYAFVSNRGGAGKSSLVSQVAPAVALRHPDKKVLLLDLSIQGDASVIALGGTGQPAACVPGVRTRGAEVIASLPPAQTAAGFLRAALPVFASAPPPPPPAAAPTGGFGGMFYRPAAPPPAAPPPFDWTAHCVNASAAFPAGSAPPNLWVAAGGKPLYNLVPAGELVPSADALRAVFAAMGPGVLVLIDTDAELAERTSSLLGIAAARHLAMVLTSSWTDYQRVLDDAANGLFAGLSWLAVHDAGSRARVGAVVFNNVKLLNKTKGDVCGSPAALSFTPPGPAKKSIEEIVEHLHQMCTEPNTNFKEYFEDGSAFGSAQAFAKRYVTGLATVPDSVWQECTSSGTPVVAMTGGGEPRKGAADQVEDVAKRILFQ